MVMFSQIDFQHEDEKTLSAASRNVTRVASPEGLPYAEGHAEEPAMSLNDVASASLRTVAERLVDESSTGGMSVLDLLDNDSAKTVFATIKSMDAIARIQFLRDAVALSDKLVDCGHYLLGVPPDMPPGLVDGTTSLYCDRIAVSTEHVPTADSLAGCEPAFRKRRNAAERRGWVAQIVAQLLHQPSPEIQQHLQSNGSIRILDLFAAAPMLARAVHTNVDLALRSVAAAGHGSGVASDLAVGSVRIATEAEQLSAAAELSVSLALPGQLRLVELMQQPPVEQVLGETAGLDSTLGRLRSAVESSELLQLLPDDTSEELDACWVGLLSPWQVLCRIVERMLADDFRASQRLKVEGEVPLSWIAEQPCVQAALPRLFGMREVGVEAFAPLRAAIEASNTYVLDATGGIVLPTASALPTTSALPHSSAKLPAVERNHMGKLRTGRSRRYTVSAKDVKFMRQLLSFYFQPFNLQHNRMPGP